MCVTQKDTAISSNISDLLWLWALFFNINSKLSSKPTRPPVIHVYSRQRCPTSDPDRIPSYSIGPNTNDSITTSDQPSSDTQDHDLDAPIFLGKVKCLCTYPISSLVTYGKLSSTSRVIISTLVTIYVPKTAGKTMNHYGWQDAMIDKINALNHNNTWDLIDLDVVKKAIGYKWVFTMKVNSYGFVSLLKAMLVSKEYLMGMLL